LAKVGPFSLALKAGQLWSYFLNLKAHVITSCCGSLFSVDEEGVAGGLAALPIIPMQASFFGMMALALASGFFFC